ILDRALCKNPAQRFPSIHDMSKQVAAVLDTSAGPALSPGGPAVPDTAFRRPAEAPTQVFAPPRQRLADVSGPLLAATFLAGLSAYVLGVLLQPGDWQALAPVFFLTTLGCAAVLIAARLWTRPVEESWLRR